MKDKKFTTLLIAICCILTFSTGCNAVLSGKASNSKRATDQQPANVNTDVDPDSDGSMTDSGEEEKIDDNIKAPVQNLSLAITFPSERELFLTKETKVAIKGTCSKNVKSLIVEPSDMLFSDADCSDGLWSLAEASVPAATGGRVTISAKNADGTKEAIKSIFVANKLVLGQKDFLTHSGLQKGLNLSYGQVESDNTRFIVSDDINNRVLIWNSIPTQEREPDVVLGQPSISTLNTDNSEVTAASLNEPTGIAISGNILVIADTGNNRVLVWSPLPTVNNTPANLVLGQTDFSSRSANQGNNSSSDTSLSEPVGVWTNGNILYVADKGNNRIMIWDGLAAKITANAHGAAAVGVIGQSNFTTKTAGVTASKLRSPVAIDFNETHGIFCIADVNNHRVLVYENLLTPPTANLPANFALGQVDLISNTSPATPSASSLRLPTNCKIGNTQLFIGDGESRVVAHDIDDIGANADATMVIGQPDFTSTGENQGLIHRPKLNTLRFSRGIHVTKGLPGGEKLFIADTNSRVLIFNTIPATNNASADFVIGQRTGTTRGVNVIPASKKDFSARSIAVVDDRLFVCDNANSRLLMFKKITQSYQEADYLYGQTNWTATGVNDQSNTNSLANCLGVLKIGTKLLVLDTGNNRIIGWNTIPLGPIPAPDFVIGQPNLQSVDAGLGADRLNTPNGFFAVDGHLIVADTQNNRVLIWDALTGVSGQSASRVLLQPDFQTGTTGSSQTTGNNPASIEFVANQLYVSDRTNHRILVWNGLPASLAPADFVIGQQTFSLKTSGTTSNKMNRPNALRAEGGYLYVQDNSNYRTLRYTVPFSVSVSSITSESEIPSAQSVLGQPNFTTAISNFYGISSALSNPALSAGKDSVQYVYHADDFRVIVEPPAE